MLHGGDVLGFWKARSAENYLTLYMERYNKRLDLV